ncbi:branched-chain amino acid ABC transporter permease [Pseudorhodoferax sp.]|uniref:branched-chain amino acid ABC transporter permease n=1 Tax=Pseudorhodoferax sp. TaxID=1993553 RepID=UPI002DD65467|nr:branched-chain amino acid ABC transporter permease [Pseudorhodoferax sp.]
METLLQQVASGLTTGCAYALIGLALVVVYRSTHHVNFAQGEIATVSTYMAWTLLQAGLSYWASFGLTLVLSFAVAAALERWVIGRLHGASPLATVAAFIGLFMAIHGMTGYVWGYDTLDFPSPFPDRSFFGGILSAHQLGMVGVTAAMLALLWAFFRFTSLGLGIRAAAQNTGSARLSGISTRQMAALGWGLAAVMGAVAGMMIAPQLYLDPHMMSGVLIYGFAAALLGGIQSKPGAVAGGLMLGVAENLLGAYFVGTQLKLTVAFLLIVAVLVLRPQGLFGQRSAVRV